MRIWKCDMCGAIMENGKDAMAITCRDCADNIPYANSYDVCRECAKKVDKFIRGETKTCASCLYFDYDDHGPKCNLHKEYLRPSPEYICKDHRG